MKSLWIRVDAHAIDSKKIAALSDALGIERVHALGHYVALGGEIAEHTDDGNIADVSESQIERWADWDGKRGVFAKELRRVFQDPDGLYDDWPNSMGELVKRRARDRARKNGGASEDNPNNGDGNSTENPRKIHVNSRATERDGTERNGTESVSQVSTDPKSGAAALDRDALRTHAPARAAAKTAGSAPLANADYAQLPSAAIDFVVRFYPPGTDAKRRRDVANQLVRLLNVGVQWKTHVVAATTPERLARKCREVMATDVRDSNAAIAVLFTKLLDTSDVTTQQRSLDRLEHDEEQRATAHDLGLAEQWLGAHADQLPILESNLDAEFGPENGDEFAAIARRMCRRSLTLRLWRLSGAPDSEPAHA